MCDTTDGCCFGFMSVITGGGEAREESSTALLEKRPSSEAITSFVSSTSLGQSSTRTISKESARWFMNNYFTEYEELKTTLAQSQFFQRVYAMDASLHFNGPVCKGRFHLLVELQKCFAMYPPIHPTSDGSTVRTVKGVSRKEIFKVLTNHVHCTSPLPKDEEIPDGGNGYTCIVQGHFVAPNGLKIAYVMLFVLRPCPDEQTIFKIQAQFCRLAIEH